MNWLFGTWMILLGLLPAAEAFEMSSFRWKSRLILASTSPGQARNVEAALKRETRGLADRDLVVIDISSHQTRIKNTLRPPEESIESLRRQFSFSGNDERFILLGKDGEVKARQSGSLNLGRFFALIDTMPMRREEMRRRGR